MPFVLAGMVLLIALGAWFAVWDWNVQERKAVRRAEVEAWRREYPEVPLEREYALAIEATLTRANLVTAEQLVIAIEKRHPPRLVEVPS